MTTMQIRFSYKYLMNIQSSFCKPNAFMMYYDIILGLGLVFQNDYYCQAKVSDSYSIILWATTHPPPPITFLHDGNLR